MTQKKAVFYMLWKAYREDPQQYVPAWKFVGELYVDELGEWFFMSYKTPANGVAIYHENEGLIERRETTGRSGSKYFEYRFAPNPNIDKISDFEMKLFYKELKEGQRKMNLKPIIPE